MYILDESKPIYLWLDYEPEEDADPDNEIYVMDTEIWSSWSKWFQTDPQKYSIEQCKDDISKGLLQHITVEVDGNSIPNCFFYKK